MEILDTISEGWDSLIQWVGSLGSDEPEDVQQEKPAPPPQPEDSFATDPYYFQKKAQESFYQAQSCETQYGCSQVDANHLRSQAKIFLMFHEAAAQYDPRLKPFTAEELNRLMGFPQK